MLPDKIKLEIVTPERLVYSESVDEVVLPSVEGYMGVRPGHAPLLAMLDVGEISYRVGSTEQLLAVAGGYAEVLRDAVSILAETCELAEEIDVRRAEQARDRASGALKANASEAEFKRAEVSLKKAISRIEVSRRAR